MVQVATAGREGEESWKRELEERESVLTGRAAPPELCTMQGKGLVRGKGLYLGIQISRNLLLISRLTESTTDAHLLIQLQT